MGPGDLIPGPLVRVCPDFVVPVPDDVVVLVEAALSALASRRGESSEVWATRLAESVVHPDAVGGG